MKRIRIIVIIIMTLLISVGSLVFVDSVRQYPASEIILPALHSLISERGFRIVTENRRDWPSSALPLVLRIRGLGKTGKVGVPPKLLGSFGTPYCYCYVARYESSAGPLDLKIDISDGRVYHIDVVVPKGYSEMVTAIRFCLKRFRISVQTKEA